MIEGYIEIFSTQLLFEARNLRFENFRFVTATCIDTNDGHFDIIYHFDKKLTLKSLRIRIQKGKKISSISSIYSCSFLAENEMKEMFGVNIIDMQIDYGGRMLLCDSEITAPLAKNKPENEQKGLS